MTQCLLEPSAPRNRRERLAPLLFIIALWAALFAIRLAGPTDLMENDQEMPLSYVVDVVERGEWIVQRDFRGDVSSKPPLYTWMASLVALARGGVTEFAMYLPTGLAVLGVALLVMVFGDREFGRPAGMLGAMSWLLSHAAVKHMALARTDALFTFMVTLAALLTWRAWSSGRGWTVAWLAAAGATLTKGPLGVLLAALGLLAAVWERMQGRETAIRGRLLPGVILFAAIIGGWTALAHERVGSDLFARMVGRELVAHAISSVEERSIWDVFTPPLYVLSRFAPWSALTIIGLWRMVAAPDQDDRRRRFERFLCCWLAGGVAVFMLAVSKRPDHIVPLLPTAALLAGRELAIWMRALRPGAAQRLCAALAVFGVAVVFFHYHSRRMANPRVDRSAGMQALAERVREAHPEAAARSIDAPYALQFYMRDWSRRATVAEAAEFLAADRSSLVTLSAESLEPLRAEAEALGVSLRIMDESEGPGDATVLVVHADGAAETGLSPDPDHAKRTQ